MSQSSSSTSFSPPIIDQLPEDLLRVVFQHVRDEPSLPFFAATLRCCRRWYHVGLPLLCDAIALNESNLDLFLDRFPLASCRLVRSLTVSMGWIKPVNGYGMSHVKSFRRRLRRFALTTGTMINLSTFSLRVRQSKYYGGLHFPRPILAAMVQNLPPSCVNLEIDTRGCDSAGSGSSHLCDQLRHVLPRLRSLRLRLVHVCPAIFATGFTVDGMIEDQSAFQSVVAPSLKSAVINCSVVEGTARICGSDLDAQIPLARALRELVTRSNYPVMEQFWLFYLRAPKYTYPLYHRCDVIQNKTWVIPLVFFRSYMFHASKEDGSVVFARLPDGQEVLSSEWAVEQIAEGQTWKETMSGCWMPAAAIETQGFRRGGGGAKPLPLLDLAIHRDRDPQWSCPLWHNERETGLRLLHAVQREGLTDQSPVSEITPDGWHLDGRCLTKLIEGDEDDLIPGCPTAVGQRKMGCDCCPGTTESGNHSHSIHACETPLDG